MKKIVFLMGIMTSVLKMIGCAGKSNENAATSTEFNEQISQSIEAYKIRPIHKELTVQILDTISDENLVQVIFDNLSEKLSANYDKEYETVLGWNKARQAIYMIWLLEAEVNNGGFNQFYFNSSGQFYKHVPAALKLVGAAKLEDLVQRANDTFENENATITKHQDGTLKGFSRSYEDNPLNKFDDEFYELCKTENLQQAQVDFIRKNKDAFADK